MTKTTEQIAAEIAALKQLKPHIPSRDFFGGDNMEKIRVEIEVLEALPKDITDRWMPSEDSEDFELYDTAKAAYRWYEGSEDESMSECWQPLVSRAEQP